ncbi:MAG TPA: hypothetical protein DDZ55_07120 [Firmicutes bacterium]|nr:hypothetical protein [Bacillota bacterium]
MKKRTLVLLGLFLLLAVQKMYRTSAQGIAILDFRSVTPVAPESRSLPFNLPVTATTSASFECSGLVAPKTGNRIAADRITFSRSQRLAGGQSESFLATIRFLPSDLPGEYEGIVYAVPQHVEENTERFPFLIKVRILPWIKIETASPHSLLVIKDSPSLTASNLQASAPIKLLLASNSPWRLYLRVGNTESFAPAKNPAFPIHIGIGKTVKAQDFSETLLSNGDYQLVAFGPPTVVGDGSTPSNFWTELYVTASIRNWHRYPTGVHTYPFFFSAETADH